MNFAKGNTSMKNVGKTIGIYTILGIHDERDKDGHLLYVCKCNECGGTFIRRLTRIKQGTQCKHTITHWNNERIGKIFNCMISRCSNINDKDYRWYGAKGVEVCAEWRNNPLKFEEWAITHGYRDNLTIDRIDSAKDYSPENCRWITLSENTRRAGKVNWITVNDITLTGRQWSEKFSLGINTVNKFIREYGLDKTKELITMMIKDPPNLKHRKPKQTWFSVYGIQV